MSFDIKKAFVKAIEDTGNPMAPVILQEAYANVERLGQLMASIADQQGVEECHSDFTSAWSETELDKIAGKPEFIMALAALLSASLVKYGISLSK